MEIAFIAPVAMVLLSLAMAGGQALETYHKVVLATHTATDLVSRTPLNQVDQMNPKSEILNLSALKQDLQTSQLVLYPKDASSFVITMTELSVNASTNIGTVIWSQSYSAGGSTMSPGLLVGSTITLDPSYGAAQATYLLYGQATYTFQPFGGVLSLPSVTFNPSEMLTIRYASQITLNTSS